MRKEEKYKKLKEVYLELREELDIDYKSYYAIIKRYLEILIRDVTKRQEIVYLPHRMGSIFIKRKKHKRAFHYRVNIHKTIEEGKVVVDKIPILDDYYYKVVWQRPKSCGKAKILPLRQFKNAINEQVKQGIIFENGTTS